MKNALDKIFSNHNEVLQNNLATAKAGKVVEPSNALVSGTLPFSFQLDANGNYTYSVTKYAAGITLTCSAVINDPNAVYNVTITSSDGGGGSWSGIATGQSINFQIETSFWHSTTITVTIHASVSNQNGNGVISYSS